MKGKTMKYIKVYFKKIVARESDDYWYAYSSTPSYSASATINGTASSFSVSIRKPGVDTSSRNEEQVTMWLSDITDEEALLYRDTFGSVAYLQLDADMNMQLVSEQDFQNLPADAQASLTSSLYA